MRHEIFEMCPNRRPLRNTYLIVDHAREQLAYIETIEDNLLLSFDENSMKVDEHPFNLVRT